MRQQSSLTRGKHHGPFGKKEVRLGHPIVATMVFGGNLRW